MRKENQNPIQNLMTNWATLNLNFFSADFYSKCRILSIKATFQFGSKTGSCSTTLKSTKQRVVKPNRVREVMLLVSQCLLKDEVNMFENQTLSYINQTGLSPFLDNFSSLILFTRIMVKSQRLLLVLNNKTYDPV